VSERETAMFAHKIKMSPLDDRKEKKVKTIKKKRQDHRAVISAVFCVYPLQAMLFFHTQM
jgi:hypothetical protein